MIRRLLLTIVGLLLVAISTQARAQLSGESFRTTSRSVAQPPVALSAIDRAATGRTKGRRSFRRSQDDLCSNPAKLDAPT
jgi:hypothetical protein